MKWPREVLTLLNELEQAGFEAWAVGGCVRDRLLGRTPADWDLCTNARPEDLRRIFAGRPLVLTGVKHGTVGVAAGGGVYEITTYRTEKDYRDRRHPSQVHFVDRLEEDLARRDFTVNAMACHPRRGLRDPFAAASRSAVWATPKPAFPKMRCAFCGGCALPPSWTFPLRTKPWPP